MAFIAETCRWWLITNRTVYRFDLYLFYLLVYLKYTMDALPKKIKKKKTLDIL